MNKAVYIIITLSILIATAIIFSGNKEEAQLVEIRDGVQYITITAAGGYSPGVTNAKAGIPTKLIMKTIGTYDCSASLAIRSIGYQNILPQRGETEIDIGVPEAGVPLKGICGMGMYSFQVNFS